MTRSGSAASTIASESEVLVTWPGSPRRPNVKGKAAGPGPRTVKDPKKGVRPAGMSASCLESSIL